MISATELGNAWFWLCVNTHFRREIYIDQDCGSYSISVALFYITEATWKPPLVLALHLLQINSVINYVSESIGEKSAIE